MEIIVRDGLPKDCYAFQHTLNEQNASRLRGVFAGQSAAVIDAKFPLEAISAYRDCKGDDERRQASGPRAADMTKHITDIAQKYLIPGETQDLALMSAFGIGLCGAA